MYFHALFRDPNKLNLFVHALEKKGTSADFSSVHKWCDKALITREVLFPPKTCFLVHESQYHTNLSSLVLYVPWELCLGIVGKGSFSQTVPWYMLDENIFILYLSDFPLRGKSIVSYTGITFSFLCIAAVENCIGNVCLIDR